MIFGVGTDIIEIERIEKAIKGKRFKEKVFTSLEVKLINEKGANTAAVNFAGKEAVSKAFGMGIRDFTMLDIEILRDKRGKPYVVLYNKALIFASKHGVKNIQISLSHSKGYAVAFVVIEN